MNTTTINFAEEEPMTPRQRNLLLELILQIPERNEREKMLSELESNICKYNAAEMIFFLTGDKSDGR